MTLKTKGPNVNTDNHKSIPSRAETRKRAVALAAELEASALKASKAARALRVDLNGDDIQAAVISTAILSTSLDGLGRLAEHLSAALVLLSQIDEADHG